MDYKIIKSEGYYLVGNEVIHLLEGGYEIASIEDGKACYIESLVDQPFGITLYRLKAYYRTGWYRLPKTKGETIIRRIKTIWSEQVKLEQSIENIKGSVNRSKIFNPGYISEKGVIKQILSNMVKVEGGTFFMNSIEGDCADRLVYQITLSDFSIGKYVVTQEEWEAIMGSNPTLDGMGPKYPVVNISYMDCQQFIDRLNTLTGLKFRLPTDAEWEYAARGGNKSQGYEYSGSNNIDDVAWYCDNSYDETNPVGTKQPNELGIYDMSGNVWEWCTYRSRKNSLNTRDTSSPIRGGDCYQESEYCWVVTSIDKENYEKGNIGLRLVLDM